MEKECATVKRFAQDEVVGVMTWKIADIPY